MKEEEAEKRTEKEEDMRERKKTSELRWPVMSLFLIWRCLHATRKFIQVQFSAGIYIVLSAYMYRYTMRSVCLCQQPPFSLVLDVAYSEEGTSGTKSMFYHSCRMRTSWDLEGKACLYLSELEPSAGDCH